MMTLIVRQAKTANSIRKRIAICLCFFGVFFTDPDGADELELDMGVEIGRGSIFDGGFTMDVSMTNRSVG